MKHKQVAIVSQASPSDSMGAGSGGGGGGHRGHQEMVPALE